ncbi:DUF2799 domain-containing protein [Vibrio kyushuensis]|uniref:DUF2799 domain-containing protein n=1 Tax=Vibrio kyushuensis TaxID=2910249 RepID=UPI003D0DEB59
MKKIIALALVGSLVGCVSSTEQLAESGDWYQIGYQDGVKGHTERSYKDLAKLGGAKQSEYTEGYTEGVTEYCNPNFAYQMGISGQYYEGVCEGMPDSQKFRMEWQRGWAEYSN